MVTLWAILQFLIWCLMVCGSWISPKHSHWWSDLKPQHCPLLPLRWDSSFLISKWPAAAWEHQTSQPWTFKSWKAAAGIPAEQPGWNLFWFPVLWPNLLGFTHGHFWEQRSCSQDEAIILLLPSQKLLQKTHYFDFLCTLYCPFYFSKWAQLQNLPQLVSPLCGTMGHVPSVLPPPSRNIKMKLQAALTLNKSPFRALKTHHY